MKRECGDCQLCCRLLPVRSLGKGGGEKCRHQKFGVGCKVYSQLYAVSPECCIWSCRWVVSDDTADLSRPDRSHFVVDMMPDFVTLNYDDGRTFDVPAIQVWVDPRYPDAHKDPSLRRYLVRRAEQDGSVAIIRYAPTRGFVLVPPPLNDGEWLEHSGGPTLATHSAREIIEALR